MRRVLAIVALVLLFAAMTAPATSTTWGGTDRHVKGSFTGLVTFEFGWTNLTCPVTTVTDNWSAMSLVRQGRLVTPSVLGHIQPASVSARARRQSR